MIYIGLFHRNFDLTGPICIVFHAESEFHNETCQNMVPGVEKSTFDQIHRKIMKIDVSATVFYGEYESELRIGK